MPSGKKLPTMGRPVSIYPEGMESLVDGRQIYPIWVKVIANPLPQPIGLGVIRSIQAIQQV